MSSLTRREFLACMGASMALAALTGCAPMTAEHIVPYVHTPPGFDPSQVVTYATGLDINGVLVPVMARSTGGRPVKLDGNPGHPASTRGSDAWLQGSLLSLYDPDRSRTVLQRGTADTWDAFTQDLKDRQTLHLLTGPLSSPSLLSWIDRHPQVIWHSWNPIDDDNARTGAILAFGREVSPQYRFDRADLIVSLDADFLGWGAGRIRSMADFGAHRKLGSCVLHSIHSVPSLTSANADHRHITRDVGGFAVGLLNGTGDAMILQALQQATGRSLVLAGSSQPPWVHAIAHTLNEKYGNVDRTVSYIDPVVRHGKSLNALVASMATGDVKSLLILGVNPAYDAPPDLAFGAALARVQWKAHWGSRNDETGQLCQWHVPATHDLETWADGRAHDGTVSVVQPLIEPLFKGVSALQMLAAADGKPGVPAYDLVREAWPALNDADWRQALHDGYVRGSEGQPVALKVKPFDTPQSVANAPVEVTFRPDPSLHDGRFANNGWLQELPRPFSQLTWENAVHLGPELALRSGLSQGDLCKVTTPGGSVELPVWIWPGQADGVALVFFGYGRTAAGQVGNHVGSNAYLLRSGTDGWSAPVTLEKTGSGHTFATTQGHHTMDDRAPVRTGRQEPEPDPPTMNADYQYEGYKWGMVIDLTSCIGCKACTIACQAENNIPVVGRDQVLRGREMHWIRVDNYITDDGDAYFQPVPCMHCERAPCELVCPVGATVTDTEGINDMVYNRCVGTRYCSNNCPYKVRRFNFLQYSPLDEPVAELVFNPDVTVRPRGVMEKCTYCIQRISTVRAQAEIENRFIRDGEMVTACQQACPTSAISFGNLNDPKSEVTARRKEPTHYALLGELNTRPRTTYLARLRDGV